MTTLAEKNTKTVDNSIQSTQNKGQLPTNDQMTTIEIIQKSTPDTKQLLTKEKTALETTLEKREIMTKDNN